MKAPRVALSILTLILGITGAACQSPCLPNVQRQLQVTNNSSQDIWIGGGGGALRAVCVFTATDSCIPADGHYSGADGTCDCGTGKSGVLACPGISSPKLPYTLNGQNCGCYQDSDCGPGAGCNPDSHLCYYMLPDPYPVGFTPTTNPWQVPPGGTVDFCVDAGSVTYPTPSALPSPPSAAPVSGFRRVRHFGMAATTTPTATPTPAQVASAVWWSGGVFARTGCNPDGTQCTGGDCLAQPNSNCPAGKGGGNPATIAEFTLQRTATDYYDVTIINGVNIAEQMAPIPTATQSPGSVAPDYWCKTPGGTCNWNLGQYISKVPVLPTPTITPTPAAPFPSLSDMEPESASGSDAPVSSTGYSTVDYTYLLAKSVMQCSTQKTPSGCPEGFTCSGAPGACIKECASDSDCPNLHCIAGGNAKSYCQCNSESDCPGDQLCGTQFIPGVGPNQTYLQMCGNFGGWWTVDDFCGNANDVVGPFNCSNPIPNGSSGTTNLNNLLLCTGANAASCYNTSPTNQNCCGCATAPSNPLVSLWPQNVTMQCQSNNPTWASVAQPLLANLKQACPTAYTYPYDDATSTFQCQGADPVNMLGYKITFADLVAPTKPQP